MSLASVAEDGRHQRQRGWGQHGCRDALQRARRDQGDCVRRNAAEQRRAREQHQADDEHAAAPEQVGSPATKQQKAAKRQRIPAYEPLQPLLRQAKLALDRG